MSEFLYVPPYRNWGLFGTVTIDGASPDLLDADHQAAWLVDGRPGFPLRLTDPEGGFTVTNTAGLVSLVAVCHHLLDEDVAIDVSGDVTASLVAPAVPRNGVPLNFATRFSEVSGVDSVSFDVSGSPLNSTDVLIGELIVGAPLVLDPPMRVAGSRFGERHYGGSRATDLSGIPGYSERARSRPLSGSQYYSQAQLDLILEWWDSQDGHPYPVPSLIIPDSDNLNDCRLVLLSEPTYTQVGPDGSETQWLVDLEFTELPRTRW